MTKKKYTPAFKGNFIAGEFRLSAEATGEFVSRSPADASDELGKIRYSYRAVDEAVGAAREAFSKWRKIPQSERIALMRAYQVAIKRREEELAEIIAREVGKPLWEAKTEVTTMINKVDVTIHESLKLVADIEVPQILPNTHGVCKYRPLGVMAVIGPFNFPGHLPNGHFVPALLTGNTVVFKPSEKAPMVGQIVAECMEEAGFPRGVFNLLHGEKEVGRRLVVHESVDAVLFTGSYEVGVRIKQDTLQQHWKLLALEMGGKNATIIWDDADLEHALHETLVSAFVFAGQRCTATSRILVHSKLIDQFVSRFHERSKAFSIGHPMDNPFMGPMIDSSSVDRYMKFQGIAAREGAELLMRGKSLELPFKGNYVTPSICLFPETTVEASKKSVFQQTEIFAPCVGILPVNTIEDAIGQANITQYGLASSVFTKSRDVYQKFAEELEMGLVNWNKSTVGASSRLPFGGLKKSGNHFPTALTSTLYCTAPVASLEMAETPPVSPNMPGLNWK